MDTTIQETEVDDMIFCNSLIDQMWDNWLDELQKDGIPQEEAEAIQHFALCYGCTPKSPAALMYQGFRAGIGYGLDLADRMDKAALEKEGRA